MTFAIEWHHVAEKVDLPTLRLPVAERICAAILHFAATGKGDFQRVSPTDPRRIRLLVPGAVAVVFVDLETRTVHVGRVFERR